MPYPTAAMKRCRVMAGLSRWLRWRHPRGRGPPARQLHCLRRLARTLRRACARGAGRELRPGEPRGAHRRRPPGARRSGLRLGQGPRGQGRQAHRRAGRPRPRLRRPGRRRALPQGLGLALSARFRRQPDARALASAPRRLSRRAAADGEGPPAGAARRRRGGGGDGRAGRGLGGRLDRADGRPGARRSPGSSHRQHERRAG